jgi:hypothetical protein
MISTHHLAAAALLALSLAACGGGGGDTAKADAAKAYPATPVPAKGLEGVTIGLPPGGKLEAGGPGMEDRAGLETADYKLMIKPGEGDFTKVKDMLGKMKTFKGWAVDAADGFIAELDEPSGKQFMVTRSVKAGDKAVVCDSAMSKPAKTLEKAQEAFAVCGTLKK